MPGCRAELKAGFPDLWERVGRRRDLMIKALGIPPGERCPAASTDGTGYLPPSSLANERFARAVLKKSTFLYLNA